MRASGARRREGERKKERNKEKKKKRVGLLRVRETRNLDVAALTSRGYLTWTALPGGNDRRIVDSEKRR